MLKLAITAVDKAQKISEDLQKALKANASAVKAAKDGAVILKKLVTISGTVSAALKQTAQTQKAIG